MLPAASVERYSTGWMPLLPPSVGAGMTTEVPVVHKAPPSRLYSVFRTPLPTASFRVKLSATALVCQAPSAPETVVVGSVASIFTTQLLGVSVWPAASVERNCTVCVPSPPPPAGAGMTAEAPVVQETPPSRLYSVFVTPLPAPSLPEELGVTGVLCQAPSAPETLVVGAATSILTVQLSGVSTKP